MGVGVGGASEVAKFWTDYTYEKNEENRKARDLRNKIVTDILPVVCLTEAKLDLLEILIIDEKENGALLPLFRTTLSILDAAPHKPKHFNADEAPLPIIKQSNLEKPGYQSRYN